MIRRAFLASLLLAPLVAVSPPARALYQAPTLTRLPFKLPKATGPFIPRDKLSPEAREFLRKFYNPAQVLRAIESGDMVIA